MGAVYRVAAGARTYVPLLLIKDSNLGPVPLTGAYGTAPPMSNAAETVGFEPTSLPATRLAGGDLQPLGQVSMLYPSQDSNPCARFRRPLPP